MSSRPRSDDNLSLPIELWREVSALCDEYEREFSVASPPPLLPLLERIDPIGRSRLLEEVVAIAIERFDEAGVADYEARLLAGNEAVRSELESLLRRADETASYVADCESERAGVYLTVRCPHCRTPMELLVDADMSGIECEACGDHFSLTDDTANAGEILRIGHFRLLQRVGKGSFGVVWKADDEELDRTVAIKMPRQGQLDQQELRDFLREARSNAQLKHRNIVPVHEVGLHNGNPFIISDFIVGGTLEEWLAEQPVDARHAVELCIKIANGLHHAHENGVVHRDLKPANIMLDGDLEPHVMDFGLAKRDAGEATVSMNGALIGTPAYMPPEQARGEGSHADRRSDIYSLGVILYELLTCERPFRGTWRRLIDQAVNDEPPSPRKLISNIPKDLETIVLRCLEKDPKSRFATAHDLAEELQRFLDGVPIHSRPVSRAERAWRWSKRHKAATSALAMVAALIVVVIGWGVRETSVAQTLRLQLSDNLVKTAELHSRKGEWTKALEQLDEAARLGVRDHIRLRLERIRALESLNQKAAAQRELDALEKRRDLGDHESEVRMLQGMSLLASHGLEEAEPFLLSAIALKGLSESDEALIDCMLAETSPKALLAIRRAVEADQYDHESRRFLVFMLFSVGNFEEAQYEAEVGQALFPDDPNFPLLLAQLAMTDNRVADIDKYLKASSVRQMDAKVIKEYGHALHMMHEFQQEFVDLWDFATLFGVSDQDWNRPEMQEFLFSASIPDRPTFFDPTNDRAQELVKQFDLVGNLVTPNFGNHQHIRSPSDVVDHGPRCFAVAYNPLSILFSKRTRGYLGQGRGHVEHIDQLIDRLEHSFAAHPEGFLSYARGQLLFVRGRLPEAAAAFDAASREHSCFGNYQPVAKFAAARAEYEVYRKGDEAALQRAVEHMQTRLEMGELAPHHAEALYHIALVGEDYASARQLIALLVDFGLTDNHRWLRSAQTEFNDNQYQAALEFAQQVDPQSPQATEAATIVQSSRASLQQLIDAESPGKADADAQGVAQRDSR